MIPLLAPRAIADSSAVRRRNDNNDRVGAAAEFFHITAGLCSIPEQIHPGRILRLTGRDRAIQAEPEIDFHFLKA